MFSEFDRLAMTRALALAERGLETTHPNPRVGCVIAKGDRIIGEGFHERAGEPHAEVMALRSAKEPVAGATAYVTLEPCSHHGRTPPCANALIEARIARVVFAVQDPNPRVSGQGADALLRAGITVEAGLMEAEATELNIGFMKRMRDGLPWVRVKLAMSLDGRTALANGASQWITGEAARADVHRWRARSSAIMTGVGSVLADDPQLNVRLPGFKGRQPLRVVLDARLRSPVGAKLFSEAGGGEVMIFASADGGVAAAARGAGAGGAATLTGDMAELVNAFEMSPTSVAAREDGVAGAVHVKGDGRGVGAAAGAGGKVAAGAPAVAAANKAGAGGVAAVASTNAASGATGAAAPTKAAAEALSTAAATKAGSGAVGAAAPTKAAADASSTAAATKAGSGTVGAAAPTRAAADALGTAAATKAASTATADAVPGAVMDLDRSAALASGQAGNWSVRTAAAVAASPDGSVGSAEAPGVSPPVVAAAGDVRGVAPSSDDATWAGAALSGAIPVKPESDSVSDGAKPTGVAAEAAFQARAALLANATIGDTVLITPAAPAGAAPAAASAPVVAEVSPSPPAAVPTKSAGKQDPPDMFQARRAALTGKGVRIENVASDDGFLDLFAVLKKLGEMEVNEVLVEAGPTLAGQLLTTFLVDELVLYVAPKLLGPQGRPLVNLPELQSLQDAWGFSLFDAKRFGDDLRLRMRPK